MNNTRVLDYSLETAEERNELVKKIVEESPPERLTPYYLTILADYIIFAMDKEEKKEKKILTQNRLVTVNKRETSYQGLAQKLENGEDGIYNMVSDLGKAALLSPKIEITESDIAENPNLKKLRENIEEIEEQCKRAKGKRKYLLKKQLIEMRQEQYILKDNFSKTSNGGKGAVARGLDGVQLPENITVDNKGVIHSDCLINFFNPDHITAILQNYSALKESAWGKFDTDLWYVMESFDTLVDNALKERYPKHYDILIMKIDGRTNAEIKDFIIEKYGIEHTPEYISLLWKKKIPRLIADKAAEDALLWYYTFEEKGKWKKCSRCGKVKLAHSNYFSRNSSSKDGFYSVCKDCRNHRKKGG